MSEPSDSGGDQQPRGARARAAVTRAARRINDNPRLVKASKLAREVLPGDSRFGDPLSTAGKQGPEVVGRRVSELTAKRPGVLREAGLSALQVWQSLAESQGRGRGTRELAIVFTDLVEFSTWALEAGDDDRVLELLRDVAHAIEPPVTEHGGEVVKRLGDGMMAVFDEPQQGLDAIVEACRRLGDVKADGYEPEIRAGMHIGHPRRLGGDYLGVDVNIAARMAEAASGGEVILSDRALDRLEDASLDARKKRRLKVKGVPKDLTAYSVSIGR